MRILFRFEPAVLQGEVSMDRQTACCSKYEQSALDADLLKRAWLEVAGDGPKKIEQPLFFPLDKVGKSDYNIY
jgi:hypothetical protein